MLDIELARSVYALLCSIQEHFVADDVASGIAVEDVGEKNWIVLHQTVYTNFISTTKDGLYGTIPIALSVSLCTMAKRCKKSLQCVKNISIGTVSDCLGPL